MEKVQEQDEYIQAISCVEDMPAVAADIVSSYCIIHEIDEKDIYINMSLRVIIIY